MNKNRHGTIKKQVQGAGKGPGQKRPWYAPPQTGKQAHHIAASEAQTEYLPVIRTIKGSLRASQQRETQQLPDWFGSYKDTLAQAQGQNAAAYKGAQDYVQNLLNQTGAAATANTQALDAQDAASAQLRGAPTSTAPARTETAGANQRAYLGASIGGTIAGQGANDYAYLGNQRGVASEAMLSEQAREHARQTSIRQDLGAARKERGAKTVSNLSDLRTTYLDNALKTKAFGLDKASLAEKAANDAAGNRISQQNANSSRISANASKRNSLKPDSKTPYGETNYAGAYAQFVQSLGSGAKKASLPYVISHKQSAIEALIAPPNAVNPKVARRVVNDYIRKQKRKAPKPQGPYSGASPGLGG